jgi:predicted nucleic acid-binding protein
LPDAIASECVTPTVEELLRAGAKLVSLTGYHVELVEVYAKKYKGPSVADLFALSFSRTEGYTLLSGDKKLREAAKEERIPVHGDLWLLDELISEGLLAKSDAIVALESMRENGARLPAAECEKRIRRWGK